MAACSCSFVSEGLLARNSASTRCDSAVDAVGVPESCAALWDSCRATAMLRDACYHATGPAKAVSMTHLR